MNTAITWTNQLHAQATGLCGANIPWLNTRRQRAFDRFATEGWPTTKQEKWRHTTLAALDREAFSASAGVSNAACIASLRVGQPGHWLVFTDGHYVPDLSEIGQLPSGVTLGSLSQALATQPDLLESCLGTETDGSSIQALNLALVSDGAFVHIARGQTVDLPIHLVFVSATDKGASFVRNAIVAEAGSRATIVEHFVGADEAAFTNTVTRASLAADAHITHLKLQQESLHTFHLGALNVSQGANSVLNSHSMSFGARLARNDITTTFDGKHCETLLNGLYYVDGRRHVDHHTHVGHAQPDGISREYYRGILADTSRGVFCGRVLVSPGADGTDSVQRSDSLLLSRMARADSRPELEIYADDVKCAHGATVGQIDENSLFYLRSRGLDETHARNLVVYAFAAEALGRIDNESLRLQAGQAVRRLLPGGQALGELA